MPLTAPKTASNYEPAPAGNHVARLYQIIHVGTVPTEWQGEKRKVAQVRLSFELCNEKKEFKEGEGEKPIAISTRFLTFSMGRKANLRKLIEGMLGVSLYDEEAASFDLEGILGRACLLNVVHTEGTNGVTYANVQGASPLPRGLEAPEMVNEAKLIDINTVDIAAIEELPEFIKEKMYASDEYAARTGKSQEVAEELSADDIPFEG